jgi:hypothetical protein
MVPWSPRAAVALAAFALTLVPLVHCNEDDTTTTLLPASGTIGPAGGSLISSDQAFELLVPPGALTTNVSFTITAVTSTVDAGELTPAYAITPAGQKFAVPVTLSFPEEAIATPALADGGTSFHDPSDYRVAALVGRAWTPLANPSFDALAARIDGTASTIAGSAYSVILPTGGSCTTVTSTCSVPLDGGCASACAPSVPGKCAANPGAVAQSCAVTSTTLTVSCCYPTGVPVCFTQPEPNGCGTPCEQHPGSTVTSCTAAIGGQPPQSTCCFPAGTALVDGGTGAEGGVDASADAALDAAVDAPDSGG